MAQGKKLFWISFLTLFLEVLLIRWVPGQLRIVAYYTNFILLAAFFGLGWGLISSHKTPNPTLWLLKLLAVVLVVLLGKRVHLAGTMEDVPLYAIFREFQKIPLPTWIYLPILFGIHAALFVDLGRYTARAFNALPPLKAYAINLAGGLAGLAGFAILNKIGAQPVWWLIVALGALGLHEKPKRGGSEISFGAISFILLILFIANDRGDLWSPYYKLRVTPLSYIEGEDGDLHPSYVMDIPGLKQFGDEEGFNIEVNDDYITFVLGMDDSMIARHPFLQKIRDQYQRPFKYARSLDSVLVLGSGGGTDLAEANRLGAGHVTAVEIDPEIARLGRGGHPENPYGQPNVELIIDDARHFLSGPVQRKYDLILFSYLDSHRLVSRHAGVRLESFLYTADSFKAALRHLKPDGVLVVRHVLGGEAMPFIGGKFSAMLAQAAGEANTLYFEGDYLAVPNAEALAELRSRYEFTTAPTQSSIAVPTDDWPYLYLAKRGVPRDYLKVILVLAIIVFAVFALRRYRKREGPALGTRPAIFFFSIGAAFLLLETKSVTEWALLFGSTWQVNNWVFATILALAFSANLAVWKGGALAQNRTLIALGLAVVLTLAALLPLAHFAGASLAVRLALGCGLGLAPVFFSGLLFSREMARQPNPGAALGANLLGAMAGGFLEYMAMATGFRALLIPIAIFYAIALITSGAKDGADL